MIGTLSRVQRVAIHLVLSLGAVLMVIPFVWMVLTSFKTISESTLVPPTILPRNFSWANYLHLFDLYDFGTLYVNTVASTVVRVAAQLLFCSLAAFAFARLRFPGRGVLFGITLSVMMIPPMLYLIPKFLLMAQLGWVNTFQGFVVPGLTSAFGVFLLRQFFLSLPDSLFDAARIDGCGPLRTFALIMLPLAKPGLVALGIFATLGSWNELLWPLVILNSPDRLTLSVGLAALQGQYVTNYPAMMAGAVMAVIPMLVLFLVLQRQFIEGIALTGTKA